jgi:hypothetical protein
MRKPVITLSQACDGMIRSKTAERASVNTVRNYRTAFRKLQAYFASHPGRRGAEPNDPPLASITRGRPVEFFATPSPSPICATRAICSRCKRYWGIPISRW